MRTLILALGNPILSDDRIGWEVADRLAERTGQIDIIKSSGATMDIIPKLAGYEQVVVIDAVKFGSVSPGQVHRFSLDDLAGTVRPSSPHDINFATAFKMAKQWGYDIPGDIRIYGIEVNELLKFSENCTPQVAEKLDEIVEYIANDLPH
ncbi:MAG: hydrogenase maturation protease [Planctomycetota bacterium]|jgi:hydrogenase maturation protease